MEMTCRFSVDLAQLESRFASLDRELPQLKAFHVQAKSSTPFGERVSSYSRLQHITAWVLWFLDGCRRKKHSSTFLTTQELIRSHQQLLHISQLESYPEVLPLLANGKPLPPKHPLITVQPVLEEGMLRVKGRAGNAVFIFSLTPYHLVT